MFERLQFYFGEDAPPIEGTWERHGDDFYGCRLLVRQGNDGLEGILLFVPNSMRDAGWEGGELKWRNIRRIDRRTLTFEDRLKRYHVNRGDSVSSFSEGILVFQTPKLLFAKVQGRTPQRWHLVRH